MEPLSVTWQSWKSPPTESGYYLVRYTWSPVPDVAHYGTRGWCRGGVKLHGVKAWCEVPAWS